MNNKMRQEILEELKFLLKEIDISTNKGFFSQDQEEVLTKIQEADIESKDGIKFINLTDFGKMVNERSLASLINSIKDANLSELDSTGDAAIKKLCSNKIVLVDEYGSVDPYFYVKCKDGKPFSAVRLGYEGKESEFKDFIKKIENGTNPTPTPSPAPQPSPTTKPEEGTVGAQGKNSFKCPNQDDVAVFQQWLGVKEDCSVGVNTIKAAQGKGMTLNLQDYFSAGTLSPEQKQKQIQFCNSLKTNRPGYEAAITKAGQTVRGKCSATSSVSVKESKNYYDNKKLNEAKQLFNKLMKNL